MRSQRMPVQLAPLTERPPTMNYATLTLQALACCLIPLGVVAFAFGLAFTRAHAKVAAASKGAAQ
jgi:hypothetical protein